MNFDFQQMKDRIQQEFDAILDAYPTDLSAIADKVPTGGDAYLRKQIIIENAAELCPVHIFPHYPFAYELDVGQVRHITYFGIGNLCLEKSGVDFSRLQEFQQNLRKYNLGSINSYYDFLHNTMNFEKLLSGGFRGVYEACGQYNAAETDEEKRRYRELVMVCCRAVEKIGMRLKQRAAEMLESECDEDVRYNLERIVSSKNTPWEAPETTFEALNAILCASLFISGLDGVEMNCYGQLDRLLEPFYRNDLAAGRITEEEAYFLIQCFLYRVDFHCHFNEERKTYDNGNSVAIGGCMPDGTPVYNEITRMILRAYTENKLINPKLNARASAQSPREYLTDLVALMQTGNNNIIVENDDYIIPMFERMGISTEDARTYVGNGCQEVICNNQVHSRAFQYFNMPQVLRDTFLLKKENMTDFQKKIYAYSYCWQYPPIEDSFENWLSSFRGMLCSLLRVVAEENAVYEKVHSQMNPEPMLSAFTEDCIANGKDRSQCGARYNHKTFALVGFGTLCDSLLRLQDAFDNGTQQELIDAMANDFSGQELFRQQLLHSRDRFGHSEKADAFAARLAKILARVTYKIRNADGIEWGTSLFTHYLFKVFGDGTGATPDGRRAGEPLSRQMNMVSIPELTDAVRSMAELSEANFHDVGVFDLTLPFTTGDFSTRQMLADFIRTCLQLKIPVLQTNVADVQMMKEERDHKGTHPDLVVRVCGYSAYFGVLGTDMQDEIIARAK